MIVQGEMGSGKTCALIEKYIELVNSGVEPDKILVLVQNSYKRSRFSDKVRAKLKEGAYPKLNIYTFFGLCYNFVSDFWPKVESEIKNPNASLEPNMCGLEVSQHIFKKCVETTKFSGYNSKTNLLHQLLRRYSLIVQNALSDKEVQERTKILKESFTTEARAAVNLYKAKTLSLRAFDYLRQVGVFSHLYKVVKNPYEYVLLDDGDEITPACFEYLKHIKPSVKEFFIAYDELGSSRLGYLSARMTDFECFLSESAVVLGEQNTEAQKLFKNVKADKPFSPKGIDFSSTIRRDEMISQVVLKINAMLKKGVKPNEIAIVTPCIDGNLKYFLKDLKAQKFFLSGSEKLTQNPYVAGVLTFLKIINSSLELKYALQNVSKVEYRAFCLKILDLPLEDALEEGNSDLLQDFVEEVKNLTPSEQLYKICTHYIKNADTVSVMKINQLMKQMQDFESVFGIDETKKYLIEQLEHTIISENPLSVEAIPDDAVLIGTMQKVIDNEIRAKYHFWLDISSSQWLKQDIGPLYNSWVFQKDWNKADFGVEDNIELTLDKTARILRKLYLCASEDIYAYSSVYDFAGVENFGGVNKFFVSDEKPRKKTFKIVPRPDQQAVLDYKGGNLAVSAVAGSGKTTIMLTLILKLLENGTRAENIFVLTFMESAARNFKERVKENFPHLNELPHISTIHGLALRLLRENSNHAHVGLDDDFEIIDEQRRLEILRDIIFSLEMEASNVELYDRAISTFKNQSGFDVKDTKSPLFKKVYTQYSKLLVENNCIDYDDLLLYALKLLKSNEGAKNHYQNLAKFVIEDEAQDSSAIQQELITLLGAGHGNIIRCGDVNQSITSTFTNSDMAGFKEFISSNASVMMDHSQRCSKDVYTLANDLIDGARTKGIGAFLDVKMKPVKGKNPTYEKGVTARIFDNQDEEHEFIIQRIKDIFANDPKATVGLLLRSNWSVAQWAAFMENNSLKTLTRTDVLSNNPVYRVVLDMFNFILEPKDNARVLKLYETLRELGFYKDDKGLDKYIKKSEKPFVLSDGQYFALWWDLDYFLRRSFLQSEELALEIGDFYFKNTPQRSNAVLVSLIAGKISRRTKSFEELVAKLNEAADKPNRFGVKFFDTESTDDAGDTGGKVQIMTMHKAKGDEFDFVFVPEMTSENMNLSIEDVKLKKNTTFVEGLKAKPRANDELKQEIVEENYRLLYVAITRAKKALTLSSACKYKVYSKMRDFKPSRFLEELTGGNE